MGTPPLRISTQVDVNPVVAGMNQMAESTRAAAASINQSAASMTASMVEAKAAAESLGGASITEARHALHGLGEEIGVHVPRFVQSFVARLGGVGPALAAAFTPIAVIGLGEVLKDAVEKMSELIAKTLLFTAAQEELYKAELKANALILEANKQHAQMLREIELIGLGPLEQARLRAQWADEEVGKARKAFDEKKSELALETQKLAVLRQQREEKIAAAAANFGPESTMAVSGEFDKSIKEAEETIQRLNSELAVAKAQLNLIDDAGTMAGKHLAEASQSASQRVAEDRANDAAATVKMAQQDLAEFEKTQRSKALLELDLQDALAKANTHRLAEDAKENAAFDAAMEREIQKRTQDIVRIQQEALKEVVKAHETAVKLAEKPWAELGRAVNSGLDQMFKGILQGTQTVGQAFSRLGADMILIVVESLAKVYAAHLAHWIAVNVLEKSKITEQIGTMIAGATAKKAVDTASAVSSVTSDAAVAGAAGFASVMQALPFPENVATAPGVMAAAISQALSNLALASAAGGMDVPHDTLAMIHKNEMVLPAAIASRFRGGDGGAPGGGISVKFGDIHALDARGVDEVLDRHGDKIIQIIRRYQREFRF